MEQGLGWFGIPVLANHTLATGIRLQGSLGPGHCPPCLLEPHPCHCSSMRSFEVCYEKSCMYLITATQLFPGRVRLRKREYLCMQCGTPQAPHCLLNSPENYFAVRFSGELFNSLFPPQVNKGCPPQEDGMRYLPTLFRFIFFFLRNRGHPRHAKSYYRKRKSYYSTCVVPAWSFPCQVSQTSVFVCATFQWANIQQLGSLFFLFEKQNSIWWREKKNKKCNIINRTMLAPKSQCVVTHVHRTAEDHATLQTCLLCCFFLYTSTKKELFCHPQLLRDLSTVSSGS